MVSKRGEVEDGDAQRKRQKISDHSFRKVANHIRSLQDLRRLLLFEQDASPHTEQKFQEFRSFLKDIKDQNNADQAKNRIILADYLRSQVPSEEKDRHVLPEIFQTWHFARQSNNENLFSTITSVLTLLLKTISSFLEFQELGNSFCRILLHDDQLDLFNRGLSAHIQKENLICPCLRLLTEIVSFDGGNASKLVYRQRQTTFQRLGVFLTSQDHTREGFQKGKKSSLRDAALRFLLANIRLQNPQVKGHILTQGKLIQNMLRNIARDNPHTVESIIFSLRRDIVLDHELLQSTKVRFFNVHTLEQLATLYNYKEAHPSTSGQRDIRHSVHELLRLACISREHGVLYMSAEKQPDSLADTTDSRVTDIDGQEYKSDRKNSLGSHISSISHIAKFLQSLRPFADILQSELILDCFKVAPALVSEYFIHKTSFSFEPKMTSTWIGYSQFLLATVQLPVDGSFLRLKGHSPPVASLLDRILPLPLTQKVLTRCLTQSSSLITFFAVRILIAAFDKMECYHHLLRTERVEEHEELLGTTKKITPDVLTAFCSRLPEMKHVVAQVRACPKDNAVQRESILRLLAMYYKMVPDIALEEKFDISRTLSQNLNDMGGGSWQDVDGVRLLELEHLLEIARRSPNMQWWHKPDSMPLSPFTALLQLYVSHRRSGKDDLIGHLLNSIVMENCIFQSGQTIPPLDVLAFSLERNAEGRSSHVIFKYFDHCILRFVRKAVQYQESLDTLLETLAVVRETQRSEIDPFLLVMIEQWPFFENEGSIIDSLDIAQWLITYLKMLRLTGGNKRVLSQLRDRLQSQSRHEKCQALFGQEVESSADNDLYDKLLEFSTKTEDGYADDPPSNEVVEKCDNMSEAVLHQAPPAESEDHPGLVRWRGKDVQDVITEGLLHELLLCLSSNHKSIREQALSGVGAFTENLKASEYSEWQQIYVLLEEVIETAKTELPDNPLPYFVSCMTAHLALVLTDPLHLMYTKVNELLNKGPQWNIERLPLYWVDSVLLHAPTDYDSHYRELEWVLDLLFDGLRSSPDMDIYRKSNLFARLLSVSTSSLLPARCLRKMIDLLCRCTFVDGSTALTTRSGLFEWLALQNVQESSKSDTVQALVQRAHKTYDQVRVDRWSNGSISNQQDDFPSPLRNDEV